MKTTVSYYLTALEWLLLKAHTHTHTEKEQLWSRTLIQCALLVGMQNDALQWETVWRFHKQLKLELSYHPKIPLLVYIQK